MRGARRTAAAVGASLAALALLWGLLRFGATELTSPYRVFLLLAPGALLVLATTRLKGRRLLVAAFAGLALMLAFLAAGPLAGRGLLVALCAWLTLFVVLARGRRGLRGVVGLLLFVGGIEAVLGLVQALGGVDYIGSYHRDIGERATGTLINHNHFAGLMNMLIALTVGLLYAGYRRRSRHGEAPGERLGWTWVVVLLTGFMGLAVLLSLSRAGTVVLALTLLSMGAVALVRSQPGRSARAAALALSVAAVIGGLAASTGTAALADRFSRLAPDWQLRATLYRDSVNVISEAPLSGVGPGLFAWHLRPHQTLDAAIWWRYAHNDYIQSAAEWGLPLAAAFWALVLWRWAACVRTFWRSGDSAVQGLALGIAGALFSILIHSLVDFNLQIPATLMVFLALLGLSWTCADELPAAGRLETG